MLKKREDENLLIRSIYSKKLTKLKDEIRNLMKFIKDVEDLKDKDSHRLNQVAVKICAIKQQSENVISYGSVSSDLIAGN